MQASNRKIKFFFQKTKSEQDEGKDEKTRREKIVISVEHFKASFQFLLLIYQ